MPVENFLLDPDYLLRVEILTIKETEGVLSQTQCSSGRRITGQIGDDYCSGLITLGING